MHTTSLVQGNVVVSMKKQTFMLTTSAILAGKTTSLGLSGVVLGGTQSTNFYDEKVLPLMH